jgi:acyl-CoA synthetase (AMP-forming)/AMP-acid ligase II
MTETSPVSLQTKLDDPIAKRVETVGTVMPHLEVKIVDVKTGEILPRGEVGRTFLRTLFTLLAFLTLHFPIVHQSSLVISYCYVSFLAWRIMCAWLQRNAWLLE